MANTSQQAHIEALNRKHAFLAERIEEEEKRPSSSSTKLRKLKAQKLRLKDQIAIEEENAE